MERKMIIHAKDWWPKAIHLSLWRYELQMVVHMHNPPPNDADASSRLKAFSQIAVSPKSSHYHTFGCTAFSLTTESKQGKSKKWEGCSVLGIYPGPYTHHAGSVSLVLNITPGNAWPHFHVGHDNFFATTRYNRRNTRAKRNCQKLLDIDHTDTIENN